ncbi:MAG: hypothetical protein JSS53_00105 [Proteobacteria bacterium]|nr:hypothetical protein [Pseudomonadota bacterium]
MGLGKQKGSILFLALAILSILSLIAAFSLEMTQLEFKMTHHYLSKMQLFYFAEQGLKFAESQLTKGLSEECLTHKKYDNEETLNISSGHSPNRWHTSPNCQFTQDNYSLFYLFEHLQDDPCTRFVGQESLEGARHYQVTVQAQDVSGRQRVVLQSQIGLPIKNLGPCISKQFKGIHAGRQSWRMVSGASY